MATWDSNYAQGYITDLQRRMRLAESGDSSEKATTEAIQKEIERVSSAWNITPTTTTTTSPTRTVSPTPSPTPTTTTTRRSPSTTYKSQYQTLIEGGHTYQNRDGQIYKNGVLVPESNYKYIPTAIGGTRGASTPAPSPTPTTPTTSGQKFVEGGITYESRDGNIYKNGVLVPESNYKYIPSQVGGTREQAPAQETPSEEELLRPDLSPTNEWNDPEHVIGYISMLVDKAKNGEGDMASIQREIERVAGMYPSLYPDGIPNVSELAKIDLSLPEFQIPNIRPYEPNDYRVPSWEEAFQKAMGELDPFYQRDVNRNTREFDRQRKALAQLLNARGQATGGQRMEREGELTQQQLLMLDDLRHSLVGNAGQLAREMQRDDRDYALEREQTDYARWADERDYAMDLAMAQWEAAAAGKEFDFKNFNANREFALEDRKIDEERRQFDAGLRFEETQSLRDEAFRRDELVINTELAKAELAARERIASMQRSSGGNYSGDQIAAAQHVSSIINQAKENLLGPVSVEKLESVANLLNEKGDTLKAFDELFGESTYDSIMKAMENVTYFGRSMQGDTEYQWGIDPYSGHIIWRGNKSPSGWKDEGGYPKRVYS